jgi:hypothetical protein
MLYSQFVESGDKDRVERVGVYARSRKGDQFSPSTTYSSTCA